MSHEAKCLIATEAGGALSRSTITRRALAPNDIKIDMKFCGVCHSDYAMLHNEWGMSMFPMVPGHELAGVVTAVGSDVTRFQVGDHAGVGWFCESCRNCKSCRGGEEQYCLNGNVGVFSAQEKHPHMPGYDADGKHAVTNGGYSSSTVVNENYAINIPKSCDLAAVAPLFCGGSTVFSPLLHCKVGPQSKVGVAGMGGLGHMAVILANAMGAEVTVLSRGASKKATSLELGAFAYVDTKVPEEVAAVQGKFDVIINTVAVAIDIHPYIGMLSLNGTMVMVGAFAEPLQVGVFPLIMGRKKIMGSAVASIAEQEAMVQLCARQNLGCMIERCTAEGLMDGSVYERMNNADVKYRFVLDCESI